MRVSVGVQIAVDIDGLELKPDMSSEEIVRAISGHDDYCDALESIVSGLQLARYGSSSIETIVVHPIGDLAEGVVL
jgi:hypothetical protein